MKMIPAQSRITTVCVLLVSLATTLAMASGTTQGFAADDEAIVLPARRATAPGPVAPPDLPPHATGLRALTLDVAIRRDAPAGGASTVKQVITRTNRRVHLRLSDDREWFFGQNPVDHRRVHGQLIVHSRRAIVTYDDSALRNWLGLRGWIDVLTLGVDISAVPHLVATGDTRTVTDMAFARLVALDGSADGTAELWWNDAAVLPIEASIRHGEATTVITVERIRTSVDEDVLRNPGERFPSYEQLDLADWLE